MYMCVKLPPRNLNPNPYPQYPTNTYSYGVTIALKVCDDNQSRIDKLLLPRMELGTFYN